MATHASEKARRARANLSGSAVLSNLRCAMREAIVSFASLYLAGPCLMTSKQIRCTIASGRCPNSALTQSVPSAVRGKLKSNV